jgi:predicted amidophosphoribosyltransferase
MQGFREFIMRAEATPTTKTCTECASEIPVAARRCPMCTQPQHTA